MGIHPGTDTLIRQMMARYGDLEGMRRYRAVMPGILADFEKMTRGLKPGETTREVYRMEDRTAAICMEALRRTGGDLQIQACLTEIR